ncbi:IS256-like element IS1245 family transposase, partial [Mycobacterium avium]|uniref:IS256-like element IS1245 family transposase n=1 Tax=Mycobacterium avium TaxID=1764 RepID=UPI000AF619C6
MLDALRTADAGERITQAAETIYQALIDAELTAFIGASPHERTETRSNQRNGSRPRTLSTVAGDLELRIPKLRTGSFFPALLERRRRVDQCLFAVVMEAYLHGTSTRKVDDLVKALGTDTGISKSEVSRICKDLDTEVAAFRDRPLGDQRFPYVFLDATYCKARVNHRVVSQAVVIATGVAADGRREVLGFEVGDSEDGAFWTAFLRSLKSRGLAGVQLVISDAHAGLRSAIDAVLIGAAWQRCRVHFLRNVLAQVPKGSAEMVAAAIRTVFAQPDAEHVREQLDTIAGMLGRQFPKVETM